MHKDLEIKEISDSECPNDAFDDFTIAIYRASPFDMTKGHTLRLRDFGLALVETLYIKPRVVLEPKVALDLEFRDRMVPVVYCVKDIQKGAAVDSDDLAIKKILESKCPSKIVCNPYTAIGRKAARSLERGKFIELPAIGLNLTERISN